jgi:hypothetical protein
MHRAPRPRQADVPAFCISNTPVPPLRQRLVPGIKKHTDALDKSDAAAIAALFTEDGLYATASAAMHIERFFVPGLAQVSYVVTSGVEAVVIDPERNVDGYLKMDSN